MACLSWQVGSALRDFIDGAVSSDFRCSRMEHTRGGIRLHTKGLVIRAAGRWPRHRESLLAGRLGSRMKPRSLKHVPSSS
jgi:hypothetical protein